MLNLKHLYYFHVFAQDLSTSKAAKRLGITAPALSNQLKQLEEYLAIPLTRRIGNLVTITESGEIVLHYTAQMFSAYDALKGKISSSKEKKMSELRVGTSHNLGASFSFDLLSLVEKVNLAAAKSIAVTFESSEQLLKGLAEGRFDLIIGAFPAARPEKEKWVFERLTFPIRIFASHGLFGTDAFGKNPLKSLTLAEVVTLANSRGTPIVLPERSSILREETDNALASSKVAPTRTIECNCSAGIVQLIERGMAFGLIPTPCMLDFKCAKTLSVLGPTEGYWTHSVSILTDKGSDVPLMRPPSQLAELFSSDAPFI